MAKFFSILRSKKAQNVLEYAVLIAVVAAAFMAMSTYIKRAVQAGIYRMEDRVTPKTLRGEEMRWHPSV